MKPTPPGWPRISSAIYYDDANAAIDWLCKAFGFEVQLKVTSDDGEVQHSELIFGDGLVMVSGWGGDKAKKFPYRKSPGEVGNTNTQSLLVQVDDVEAHCTRARAAGATIVSDPEVHDYGEEYWADKTYECVDVGGHHWWFSQRVKGPGVTT